MGTLQNKRYDGSSIINAVQVKIGKDAMLTYLKMLSPRKIKENHSKLLSGEPDIFLELWRKEHISVCTTGDMVTRY
jgi:hypothetical protein